MNVRNVHERLIPAPLSQVGALLDDLGSPADRLWPRDRWPPMQAEGAPKKEFRVGHAPVRYTVEAYEPGRLVRFRFTRPKGFHGTHTFSVEEVDGGTRIRHELVMRARGWALLSWPLFFRPLHDAVLEDAFDRGAAAVGCEPVGARWSPWVRMLRWAFRPRGRRHPTLLTPRLTLHPLAPSDLPDLHAHWNEPEVGRFLWDGNPVPRDQVQEAIQVSQARFREGTAGLWAIRPRAPGAPGHPGVDGSHGGWGGDQSHSGHRSDEGRGGDATRDARRRLLGCVGFWHFHDPPELELVVSLSPDWWGRGLAREACAALIRYAFDDLAWDFVQAAADDPNVASIALMERLGMEPAGERPGEFGTIRVFRIPRKRRSDASPDHPAPTGTDENPPPDVS
jgi:RimJ/RimL family protein N-acetyltransferase